MRPVRPLLPLGALRHPGLVEQDEHVGQVDTCRDHQAEHVQEHQVQPVVVGHVLALDQQRAVPGTSTRAHSAIPASYNPSTSLIVCSTGARAVGLPVRPADPEAALRLAVHRLVRRVEHDVRPYWRSGRAARQSAMRSIRGSSRISLRTGWASVRLQKVPFPAVTSMNLSSGRIHSFAA